MNHIYRVVFNRALGLMQAVPETGKSHGRGSKTAVGGAQGVVAAESRPALAAGDAQQTCAAWIKRNMPVAVVSLTAVFLGQGHAFAASGSTTLSSNSTTSQSVSSGTFTVNSGVVLNVGGGSNAIGVKGTSTIVNNGTIEETGTGANAGRAIRDKSDPMTLTVYNNGTIEAADDDAIQMQFSDNSVALYNYGKIISDNASEGGAQGVDFAAITSGTNYLYNGVGALYRPMKPTRCARASMV